MVRASSPAVETFASRKTATRSHQLRKVSAVSSLVNRSPSPKCARRVWVGVWAVSLAFGCRTKSERHEVAAVEADPDVVQSTRGEYASGVPGREVMPSAPLDQLPRRPPVANPPELRSQLLACGRRSVARLTEQGYEVYAVPQFARVASLPLSEPSNLVAVAEDNVVAFGVNQVQRHYFGYDGVRAFTRIPRLGPYEVWPDPQDVDAFWVRYLRDPDLHYFELRDSVRVADGSGGAPVAVLPVTLVGESRALPEFDRRHFTLMADGSALYTAGDHLMQLASGRREALQLPAPSGPIVALWPDHEQLRYWVVDQKGLASKIEVSRGRPVVATLELAGVPLQHAASGRAMAVLSAAERGQGLELTLEVFERDRLVTRWPLTDVPTFTTDGFAAQVDLCFVHGRPLVLVGGRQWLMVFDYRSRRGRRL